MITCSFIARLLPRVGPLSVKSLGSPASLSKIDDLFLENFGGGLL